MASCEAVEWVIDEAASSSEEEANTTRPATATANVSVKKIPRFNEQETLEFKLQRKIQTNSNLSVTALLKKSKIIQPGFEQKKNIPAPLMSLRALRRERKKERDRTKGPGWFNLPIQEMTEEIQNDVDLLRMRSVLDKKHFYKKNDLTHVPKYFQIGTVLEGPADFYNGRIAKSQRKKTLLAELMADSNLIASQKNTYKAILTEKRPWRMNKKARKKAKAAARKRQKEAKLSKKAKRSNKSTPAAVS